MGCYIITDLLGQLFVAKDLQTGMECEAQAVWSFSRNMGSVMPLMVPEMIYSFKKVVVQTETSRMMIVIRVMIILGDSATGWNFIL